MITPLQSKCAYRNLRVAPTCLLQVQQRTHKGRWTVLSTWNRPNRLLLTSDACPPTDPWKWMVGDMLVSGRLQSQIRIIPPLSPTQKPPNTSKYHVPWLKGDQHFEAQRLDFNLTSLIKDLPLEVTILLPTPSQAFIVGKICSEFPARAFSPDPSRNSQRPFQGRPLEGPGKPVSN